jgi:outer membrane protein assembly factor BamB
MKINIATLTVALLAASSSLPAAAQERSIVTYHADASRSGNFMVPGLTWERARAVHLDREFEAHASGHVYAQPLYWRAPDSKTAILLVATESNVVQAFDARTGKEVWKRSVGHPVPSSSLPCGNIDPLGITGTPVIDPSRRAIYFDAAIHDSTGVHHKIFAASLKDGSVLQGWPVDVAAALRKQGRTFDPRVQNQRGALSIIDNTLYVPFGGHYGDCGDYHGWVVGVSLDDSSKFVSWQTRARGGGIWAPGGMSIVAHHLFFATGNTMGAKNWSDGEGVFRLLPDLHRTESKRDFFAPRDWRMLDRRDLDLGGTNPVPLDLPGQSGENDLVLAFGKNGKAYLLDRKNLGGIGGELATTLVSRQPIRTAPAAYPVGKDIYVAFQSPGTHCPALHRDNNLTVLRIRPGSPPVMNTAWCGPMRGAGSPIVTTTEGHSNPIVWIVGAEGDNRLHGFRGDTGAQIFISPERMRGLRHFQSLIATGHHLYVGADGHVYAFSF